MGPEQPRALKNFRGRFLIPDATTPRFEILDDALVTVDDRGEITSVTAVDAACPIEETLPGCVWMPGFVDTHVHFPQTRVMGSASGPLLEWLETAIFREEARFKDPAYAKVVAGEFCTAMVRQGTTASATVSYTHLRSPRD